MNALAIALQGIGYSAAIVAVQGLATVDLVNPPLPSVTNAGYTHVVSGGRRDVRLRRHKSYTDITINVDAVSKERADYVLDLLNTAKVLITSGVLECL